MPVFGNIVFTVIVYLVVLLIIVFVHEMGHYLVGRWCGIKAKVFSLGMGKVLWSREDKHGTKWQIAALPIGGYVKFVGDSNAASAADGSTIEFSPEERRHSLLFAPLWARFLTVLAGPGFNFIFAAIVFGILLMVTGVPREPLTVGSVSPRAPTGLMPGDEIVKIAGEVVPVNDDDGWDDFYDKLPVDSADVSYQVRRDGQLLDVTAPHPLPALVGSVSPLSGAREAGVQVGDWIVAIDGQPLPTFDGLMAYMNKSEGAAVVLTVRRAGTPDELKIPVQPKQVDLPKRDGSFERRWLIGVGGELSFKPALVTPDVTRAAEGAVLGVWGIAKATVSGIYNMTIGKISTCGMTGPIRIAQIVGQTAEQGPDDFIWLIAALSAAIGFMNLLPIPILDGGHLVFYTWEAVTRRRPGGWILYALNLFGLTLLLGFVAFSLFNDFFCP